MQFSGAMSFLKEKILALRRHFTWHKLGIEPLCRLELFPWKSLTSRYLQTNLQKPNRNPTEWIYRQAYSQKHNKSTAKCIDKHEGNHTTKVQAKEKKKYVQKMYTQMYRQMYSQIYMTWALYRSPLNFGLFFSKVAVHKHQVWPS